MVLFPELGITGRSSLKAEENDLHCGHVGFGSLLNQPLVLSNQLVCFGHLFCGPERLERDGEELSAR